MMAGNEEPVTPFTKAKKFKEEGNVAFKRKDYDAALQLYTRAIESSPPESAEECAAFFGNRAAVHWHLNQFEECVKDCEEALQRKPTYKKVAVRQAHALQNLGQIDAAISKVQNILINLDPYHAETQALGLELGMYTVNGCIKEEHGVQFNSLLQGARWLYNAEFSNEVVYAEGVTRDCTFQEFMARPIVKNHKINMVMYSHWLSDYTGRIGTGIYHRVEDAFFPVENAAFSDEQRRQFKRDMRSWAATRVNDTFYVYKKHPEGTVLITTDLKKVYVVLGMSDNIYDLVHKIVNGKRGNLSIAKITILPWMGKLVYDGIIMGAPATNGASQDELKRVYDDAVASNNLITGFSDDVLIAASNEVPEEDDGFEDEPELSEFENRVKDEVTAAAKFPAGSIIFRRFGYSPEENPHKMMGYIVLGPEDAPGTAMPVPVQMAGYEPTSDEILEQLSVLATRGGRMGAAVGTDYLPILARLQHVLEDSGVTVFYYPPPSEEEQRLLRGAFWQ
eukprot:m.113710 g.113710  ORF g.113710 m.113710 type:complete len:506 (-) comp14145_c0_seq1:60-1577(-)